MARLPISIMQLPGIEANPRFSPEALFQMEQIQDSIRRQTDVPFLPTQVVNRGTVDPETGEWITPPGISFPDDLGGTFSASLRDVPFGLDWREGGGAPAVPPQIMFPGADPGMQQRGAGFAELTARPGERARVIAAKARALADLTGKPEHEQNAILLEKEVDRIVGQFGGTLGPGGYVVPEVYNAPSKARQEMLAHIAARKAARKQMRAGHGVRTREQVEELLGKLSSLTEGEKDAVRSGQISVEDAIKRENVAREGRVQAGAEEWFGEVREEGKRLADQYTNAELLRRAAEEARSRGDEAEAWRLEKLAAEEERAEEVHEGAEAAFLRGSDALEGFEMGVRGTPHTTTEEFNVDIAGLPPLAAEEYAKRRTTIVGGKQGVFHPEDVPGTATISDPTGMQFGSVDPSRVVIGGRTGSDETDILRSEPGVLHPTEDRVITRGERDAIKEERTQRIADIADRQRLESFEFTMQDVGGSREHWLNLWEEAQQTEKPALGFKAMLGIDDDKPPISLPTDPGFLEIIRSKDPRRLADYINRLSARELPAPGEEGLNAAEKRTLGIMRRVQAQKAGPRADQLVADRESRRRAEEGLMDARAARALTPLGQKRAASTKAEERRARMARTAAYTSGSGARAWAMSMSPEQAMMAMNPRGAADVAKARVLAQPELIKAQVAAAAGKDPQVQRMNIMKLLAAAAQGGDVKAGELLRKMVTDDLGMRNRGEGAGWLQQVLDDAMEQVRAQQAGPAQRMQWW